MINANVSLQGYMRPAQVSEYLQIPLRTVRHLQMQGKLPCHKLSRKITLFRLSDVDKAIDRFRVGGITSGRSRQLPAEIEG